ncbi:integrase core domain-containing protein, partial [Escherichia coli]
DRNRSHWSTSKTPSYTKSVSWQHHPIKRDYISIMPKPDGLTAAKNLAEAFEHYNEWHPHSALGYRSPREYLRQRACNGLSDNRCLEI